MAIEVMFIFYIGQFVVQYPMYRLSELLIVENIVCDGYKEL